MSVHASHQCPCGSGLHESDCRCTVEGMISVYYPKLRMRGRVEVMPEAGIVLVFWDKGGSTRIPVNELEVKAES